VCDNGFFVTTTGGAKWQQMPVPGDGGAPKDVSTDPTNPNVIYAVTTKGLYRSKDYGEEFLGQTWECLSAGLPPGDTSFTLAFGTPGRIYAAVSDVLFTRRLDESGWTRTADHGFGEYAQSYPWLAADPANPDHVVAGVKSRYGGMGMNSLLQQSKDAGQTWSNDLKTIYDKLAQGGMLGVAMLFVQGEITAPLLVGADGMTMLAGSSRGALKSSDGGGNWQEKKAGFDIPVARSLMAARNTNWLFAGTPAGLFLSKDGGETWQDGHLCLQFTKNTRRELGGASFADAFWRGRYYGFIDDATAAAAFTGK
jgi:photosystem II stability/assembly factor-like uncharacterized protein